MANEDQIVKKTSKKVSFLNSWKKKGINPLCLFINFKSMWHTSIIKIFATEPKIREVGNEENENSKNEEFQGL